MSTRTVKSGQQILPLQPGDHLTRAEFERRYDVTPRVKKAELIDGVVHMPPPVSHTNHGAPHADLLAWLGWYRAATLGVLGGDNGSLRLDMDNEPQPDAYLMIDPKLGGQARIDDEGYLEGAPELVAEIAASSASYDLHDKLHVYRRHGVREYIVWRVLESEIDYFLLRDGQFDRLAPTATGYRSEVFPGLWLDTAALLSGNLADVQRALQEGLATPEHADFVARLRAGESRTST